MSNDWAAGVRLVASGISTAQRLALKSLIERGGGAYTTTLSRRNTHLLVPDAVPVVTPKFEAAMAKGSAWGLTVVTLAWALDSDRAQRRQPDTEYAVSPESSERPLAARAANAETRPLAAGAPPQPPASDMADDIFRLSLGHDSESVAIGELVEGLRKAGGRVAARRGSTLTAAVVAGADAMPPA